MEKEQFFEEQYGSTSVAYNHLKLMFDGSCGPQNPDGSMGYGYAIFNVDDDDEVLAEGWGYTLYDGTFETSNNVAEWTALYRGLHLLLSSGYTCNKLSVCGDSMLVINQATGKWGMKSGAYIEVAKNTLAEFSTELGEAHVSHVYRDDNGYCDELSNKYISYLMNNFGVDTGGEFKVENVKKKSRFLK